MMVLVSDASSNDQGVTRSPPYDSCLPGLRMTLMNEQARNTVLTVAGVMGPRFAIVR